MKKKEKLDKLKLELEMKDFSHTQRDRPLTISKKNKSMNAKSYELMRKEK